MAETSASIMWFRRDLRLGDHPALTAACASGAPVIPVVIRDDQVDGLGAAPKWRWGLGVQALDAQLRAMGSRLIYRSGPALKVLQDLVAESGAGAVHWTRAYDPASMARDTAVKATLKEAGITARSHAGHLLFEPWEVETKTGGFYKVYTPMWRQVQHRDVAAPLPKPAKIAAPVSWPASEDITKWDLGRAMDRGADVVAPYLAVGEGAAEDRLGQFIDEKIHHYTRDRDLPGVQGTSRLSENLTLGEISPRTCWHAGSRALQEGSDAAEVFLKELVWREFAYHLMYHTPHILKGNWKPDWDAFGWTHEGAQITAWKQGRTGIPFVDAAMRELYVTGTMHNRGRMIVASYLTKHLMTHWQVGRDWFEQCLVDWDPASNAMGWQWAAGSGPDAAPYFRVFNPVSQLEKFDRPGAYAKAWIAEGQRAPSASALSFFEAIPRSWGLGPNTAYPDPIVTPAEGRQRALNAYQSRGF